MKPCSIVGCEKPLVARGLCHMHYKRWQKKGDPGGADKHQPKHDWLRQVLKERVRDGSCWEDFPGKTRTKENGYPALMFEGKYTLVTRFVLMAEGVECPGIPFPKGPWEVLHSCDNKECFNPQHLRWGTRSENQVESYDRGQRDRNPPWVKDPSKGRWAEAQ